MSRRSSVITAAAMVLAVALVNANDPAPPPPLSDCDEDLSSATEWADDVNASCPDGCKCTLHNGPTLIVDCRPGMSKQGDDFNVDELSRQLDRLLSTTTAHRLASLYITNTPLTRVPHAVCNLSKLKYLHMDNNKLTGLPDNCFANLPNLVKLAAENNEIQELQDGVLDGMHSLKSLGLRWNQIASVGPQVFSNVSELQKLGHIALYRNRLRSLEPWPFYRGVVAKSYRPVIVDLAGNQISKFTNEVGWNLSFLCESSVPSYLQLDISYNNIEHVTDILNGWNVTMDSATQQCIERVFPGLRLYMAAYSYACDCKDYELYRRFQMNDTLVRQIMFGVHCKSGKEPTSQSLNYFICDVKEDCPKGCRCFYRTHNATMHVNCANSGLTSLPTRIPSLPHSSSTYRLDFSHNILRHLEKNHDYLAHASIIDFSTCRIETISDIVWMSLMKINNVWLADNGLQSLPPQILNIRKVPKLFSLRNNSWSCSCDNRWFGDWLKKWQSNLDADHVRCSSPGRLSGKPIFDLTSEDFCVDPVERAVVICVSVGTAALVLLVSACSCAYHFRVRLYTRWNIHPFDRDECAGEDMQYDVFLSCSSKDDEPHAQRVIELIRSRGYRVCYHLQNFVPGELIVDNICSSVTRSKRTVCLLSRNFVKSKYCMTEFDMAFHHNVVEKRKKRLIVLMMLSSPQDLDVDEDEQDDTDGDAEPLDLTALCQFLRQYTYIDYTAGDWLDRLLYALPIRGLDCGRAAGGDDEAKMKLLDFSGFPASYATLDQKKSSFI